VARIGTSGVLEPGGQAGEILAVEELDPFARGDRLRLLLVGRALPKKRCLELSSLKKCCSFERLKVPDTFFWAKPVRRKNLPGFSSPP